MPHFYNPEQKYHISTSFKVFRTLLNREPHLSSVDVCKLRFGTYLRNYRKFRRHPHFLLVRNPYDRLVSFFKDKLRKNIEQNTRPYEKMQKSQKLFCAHLAITSNDTSTIIQERLSNLSFVEFIKILPKVYNLDEHLYPQWWTSRICFMNLSLFPFKATRVLKVESVDDLEFLHKDLGIDLSTKLNHTGDVRFTESWSQDSRRIVNRLYQKDFLTFGYSTR